MGIQDKVIKWWVQNMYSPKIFNYSPGYILIVFNNQYGNAFQRLITLSEEIIENIETRFLEKFGDKGKDLLFESGRVYGSNFAYTAGAPVYDGANIEKISKYLQFSIKFGFYSWAQDFSIEEFVLKDDYLKILGKYDNHVVCRHNGLGVLLTESIPLGVLEFVLQKSVKVTDSKCQGRGDKYCEIVYELGDAHDMGKQAFNDKNFGLYKKYNSIKQVTYTKNSWSDLLKNKVIKISDVGFELHDNIIFTFEISFVHQLEIELNELDGGSDLLFDICFDWGKKFCENQSINFISEMLAVFGYGDVLIKNSGEGYKVYLMHFPWSPNEEKNEKYSIVRGLVSGMLSGVSKKDIKLGAVKKIYEKEKFSITLE